MNATGVLARPDAGAGVVGGIDFEFRDAGQKLANDVSKVGEQKKKIAGSKAAHRFHVADVAGFVALHRGSGF